MSESVNNVQRLEQLWGGDFGNEYVDRNRAASAGRRPFWDAILDEFPVRSALEVGCNVGANLDWLVPRLGAHRTFGVDVNEKAIEEVRRRIPGVGVIWAPARELPFRDGWVDLAFTTGVLIHQPPESLPLVMSEVVRCSRRYVLCGEYYAPELTEVPYRGQAGALFKRDFGALYQRLFPSLRLRKTGFLARSDGWDDVTYWLFEKP